MEGGTRRKEQNRKKEEKVARVIPMKLVRWHTSSTQSMEAILNLVYQTLIYNFLIDVRIQQEGAAARDGEGKKKNWLTASHLGVIESKGILIQGNQCCQ